MPSAHVSDPTADRRPPDPDTEPTITLERAARVLGISERQARTLHHRGDLPTVRAGGCVLVPSRRFLERFDLGVTPAGATETHAAVTA